LEKGFGEDVVQTTLDKLQEKGYLDDYYFARLWIENRNTFRPRSSRLLTYELHQKGVADETIKQALEQFGGDENELAYQAGIKKAIKCRDETKFDFRKKVGGFLGRRGFHYGIVKPTVEKLWENFAAEEVGRLDHKEKME
jgi:regulatory protein